jgi:hypothetical protein
MGEEQRLALLNQIQEIETNCRNQLFDLHKNKGNHVEDTAEMMELKK